MNTELMNDFQVKLISYGCTEDPMEMAKKIADSIPEATRSNFPEDVLEAANLYAEIYFGNLGGLEGLNTAATPTAVQTPVETAQPVQLTSEQNKIIADMVKSDAKDKAERTAKTRMEKILFDKPYAKDYLDAGITVIPRCTKAKLDEYESKLVQDPENIAAFNEIKAACDTEGTGNGTPMPISISDSLKTIGYAISTPATGAGSEQTETRYMTPKQLMGFLASQLSGLIPTATPEDLGCKLVWNKRKPKGAKATVAASAGTPRLRVVGRANALEDAARHDFTSKATAETKKGKLRIAKTFKILVGGTNAKGEPKTRTIRLSGDYQVPVFERKNEEYAKAFPIATKNGGIEMLSGKDAAKMQQLQSDIMAFILAQGGGEVYDYGMEDLAAQVNNDMAKNATANVSL